MSYIPLIHTQKKKKWSNSQILHVTFYKEFL